MTKIKLMVRNRGFAAIAAFLMAVLSVLGVAVPSAHAALYPSDMSGVRFTSRRICVEAYGGGSAFASEVAWAAQQFNIQSSGILLLNYRSNCAAAGYTPEQWFRVASVGEPGQNIGPTCVTSSSRNHVTSWGALNHWDRPPIFYYWPYNRSGWCGAPISHHLHSISQAVGVALGLKLVCGSAWASRVMEYCTNGAAEIQSATWREGNRISEIYQDIYGG